MAPEGLASPAHERRSGRSRSSARSVTGRTLAVLLAATSCLAASESSASGVPLDLRAHAEGRRLALEGDLVGARRAWDELLRARAVPAHAVVVATACTPADLASALERWRDAAPTWIVRRDACDVLAWGLFASADEARSAASAYLPEGSTREVIALTTPLGGSPPGAAAPSVALPAPRSEPPAAPPPPPAPSPARPAPSPPAAAAAPVPAETSSPEDAASAADLFARGNEAYSRGEMDEAVRAFRASTEKDPRNPRAFNNLGTTLLVKGEPEQAERAFRSALALDPLYARAHLNLGTALYAQGRGPEARAALAEVIGLEPRNVDAYHNLGALLIEERDWREAERVLLEGLAKNPDDARLRADLEQVRAHASVMETGTTAAQGDAKASPCRPDVSQERRARLAQRLFTEGRRADERGDVDAAEEAFAAALDCDPTSGAILNHLGATRLKQEDWDGAAKALALALQVEPGLFEAAVNLSFALFHQGRCDDAVDRLRRLVASNLGSAEARFQLGRMLYRCGRPTEAQSALEETREMSPGDDRAARLLDRLHAERVAAP